MAPFARSRASERHAGAHLATSLVQAFDEIVRQKRTIAWYADDPLNSVLLLRQPVEAGKNSGQWAGKIRHAVGHDCQAGISKPLGIAVGIDNDSRALRGKRRQHAVENRYAADFDTSLVASTHAPRKSAGEHKTKSGWMISRHEP